MKQYWLPNIAIGGVCFAPMALRLLHHWMVEWGNALHHNTLVADLEFRDEQNQTICHQMHHVSKIIAS